MKRVSRISALLLALLMVFSVAGVAFAAGTEGAVAKSDLDTVDYAALFDADEDSDATVTVAQGNSGTIPNVSSYTYSSRGSWRAVSGSTAVDGITFSYDSWNNRLTVNVGENVPAGTYSIQYQAWNSSNWSATSYTVQVTETPTWSKRITVYPTAVNFYVQLNSNIIDSSQETPTSNYTDTVFTTTVSSHPDYFDYTKSAGDETQVMISQSTTTAYAIDQDIRKLGTTEGYTASYNGTAQTPAFKLTGFPKDETVLEKISNSSAVIKINGQVIDHKNITADNYAVRWYVFKHSKSNGWHIDGILVPKTGTLTITKTFTADSNEALKAVLNSVYNTFTITTDGTRTSDNLRAETKYKLSDKTTTDEINALTGNSVTYTWTANVMAATYTIKESGAEATDANYTLSGATYTYTEDSTSSSTTKSGSGSIGESGFTMNCVTAANDAATVNQSCALTNTYAPAYTTLTVTKKVTGNMGDTSKEFAFTITSDKDYPSDGHSTTGTSLNVSGKSATVNLSSGETVTLRVPVGASITVSEDAAGYTSSSDITGWSNGSGTVAISDTTAKSVTVTNNKEVKIDTGLTLPTAPILLMISIALAMAVLLRKRRAA